MNVKPNSTLPPESFSLTVERQISVPPNELYLAWTEQFDRWFAAPGTVEMKPKVNVPFYFATQFEGKLHPHYGRFLNLKKDQLVELTWVTGEGGTKGAETIITVELFPDEKGTRLKLTHAGFSDEVSKNNHEKAWPLVLEQLEKAFAE